MNLHLQCIKCGFVSNNKYDLTCKNHSPYYSYFDVTTDLPSESLLGEGNTPLVFLPGYSKEGLEVYAKCEYMNPSGSVKDREVSAIFKFVKEEKIPKVVMVSGGSGKRSAVYFAERLGIEYECVSEGDYEENFKRVIDENLFYNVTPGINPLASEGTKMIAHELYKDLKAIDGILVPMGNGTMLAGIWKGVKEVSPEKMPKMIGVEMVGGDPVYQAIEQGVDFVELEQAPDSLAKAISAKAAFSSPKAVRSIVESGGEVVRITEAELLEEIEVVKGLGVVTPGVAAVSTFAALRRWGGGGRVVCLMSG